MNGYFDNASTTYPKPEVVYDFMDKFYREQGGNAGRGQYKLAASASKLIAETREYIQRLLQCPNKDVIFTPSDTIALNMIIQGSIDNNIKTVYISPFEHNSVTRILHYYEKNNKINIKKLPLGRDYQYDLNKISIAFAKEKPDMVVVSHASNVCGLIAPVLDIFALAKNYGALTIVDMAQTAGLVPLDTGSENIDFATFAGHKTIYGPTGISGFVKKKNLSPKPILFGGTGIDSANQDMPDVLPQKYEAGSSNIHALAGLHAALEWCFEQGDKLYVKEKEAHMKLLCVLEGHMNITVIGPTDRGKCIGVVSCLFDGYAADAIGEVLAKFDIAVRTGLECAPIAHKTLGTFPAGAVRFSVGYFTDDNDFERLEEALEYIEENG